MSEAKPAAEGVAAPAAGPLSRVLLALIAGYRRFLSPLLPTACRFTPTCSVYAAEAVRLHGPWKGTRLAVARVLRCRPFGGRGEDPVPPRACLR